MKEYVLYSGESNLKKQALAICRKPLPYWDMVKELKALGLKMERAKRMAARAKQGIFMWEGVKFALHDPEGKPLTKKQVRQYRKGEVPDDTEGFKG